MDLRDLPRVVWALAAARFVSSAASFTMLFLTLFLAAPVGTAVYAAAPDLLWPLMAAVAMATAAFVLLALALAMGGEVVE